MKRKGRDLAIMLCVKRVPHGWSSRAEQGMSRRKISVAVFIYDYSTSGAAYSGGRYHALLLAYAMAHAGIDVTVIGDRRPVFVDDLESAYEIPVRFFFTPSYDASIVPDSFDYVFVAPTGGFNPAFYACAELVAGRSKATLVLINYESPNWFNLLAPTPDQLAVWDYWRRTVVRGGIVLSSTIESDVYARHYYHSDGGPLHFAHCYPPLNSRAAALALADREGKDGSLLYFARPFHDHKGGADILELPCDLYERRILRIIIGGQVNEEYCSLLGAKLNKYGGELEVHSRIPEYEKFRLLARSSLLLFPSRFEGFGYPPLEAALVGTESVCYDLPVLRETMGDSGRFAPVGDVTAFADEARRALSSPIPSKALRDRAERIAGFERIAQQISRDLASWQPVPAAVDRHAILWGPWAAQDIRPGRPTSPEDDAPMPSYGKVVETTDGELAVEIVLWARESIASARVRANQLAIPIFSINSGLSLRNWRRTEIHFRLQHRHLGQRLWLECIDEDGKRVCLDDQFMIC